MTVVTGEIVKTPMMSGTPATDKKICGAKKKDGSVCRMAPMKNGRCRLHGGLTPTGFDLPQTKTGRYSKYLPKHLASDYEAALTDDRLLELGDNIALMDARLNELLGKLHDNETLEAWNNLGQLLGPLEKAVADGKVEIAKGLMSRLLVAWQAVYEDTGTWKDILEVTENRRRLVESEKKRLVDMDLMISADRAYMLIAYLQDIIMRHVKDDSVKAIIAYEIRNVASLGSGERSRPSGTE